MATFPCDGHDLKVASSGELRTCRGCPKHFKPRTSRQVYCSSTCRIRVHYRTHPKNRRVGPYSKPHELSKLDGRHLVARAIRELATELSAHVGGAPTPPQKILIREASIKSAKLGMLADRILYGTEPDLDIASRCYLAWANSLRRDLEVLGLKAAETPRTLQAYLVGGKAA